MNISVVIPAFNEEARIQSTLEKISQYFTSRNERFELIVVDDASRDRTQEVVRAVGERFPEIRLLVNQENRGKGFSVRRGILEAQGSTILFTDADLSTPIEEVERLFPFIENGFSVVIGSRGLPHPDIVVSRPAHRKTMGQVFNFMVQWLVLPGFMDTQCGFKCFTLDAAKKVFSHQRIDRFGFDPEVLLLARKFGYSIKEVPVAWEHSPNSKVDIIWDSLKMFRDLIRIRWMHEP